MHAAFGLHIGTADDVSRVLHYICSKLTNELMIVHATGTSELAFIEELGSCEGHLVFTTKYQGTDAVLKLAAPGQATADLDTERDMYKFMTNLQGELPLAYATSEHRQAWELCAGVTIPRVLHDGHFSLWDGTILRGLLLSR